MSTELRRNRAALLGWLVVTIALGLASRKFDSQLPPFVVEHAGDTLWTVAAFVSLAILLPHWGSLRLGLLAMGVSMAVEISQLFEFTWLNAIRNNRIGRLLLGSGWVWLDLVRYFAGACLATAIDWWFYGRTRNSK